MDKDGAAAVSEMSAAERGRLCALLAAERFTGAHLEIGTARGGTLSALMRVYDEPRPPFVVIDTMRYFPNQLETVRATLRASGVDPAATDFWVGSTKSLYGAPKTKAQRFDFVFIDAKHTHYHVLLDASWSNQLRVGGLLCFHDRSPAFPGVGWAIEQFLDGVEGYALVEEIETLVVLKKMAPTTFAPNFLDLMRARVKDALWKLQRRRRKKGKALA